MSPPAVAAPFPNCSAAEAAGRFDTPAADPAYGVHLDRDRDGIGCETGGNGGNGGDGDNGNDDVVSDSDVLTQPERDVLTGTDGSQVVGAETGVAVEESSTAGGVAVAGGLGPAAAAGVAAVVRRCNAQA